MLKKNVEKALNEQINAELYSSYLYYQMAAWCASADLNGMSSWFKVQAQEELIHASKFFDYVLDRSGKVALREIKGPPATWDSALAAFSEALKHEQHVTALINNLVDLARKEKDQLTDNFLQFFVAEQVEEEATASKIVGQLRLIGSSGSGLFLIDRELGTRTFVYPTAGAAADAGA